MSQMRFLDYQYSLSRKKKVLSRWLSHKERKISFLSPVYQPNQKEMGQVFEKFDADKDGRISREDLMRLLKAVRMRDVETLADKIMRVADVHDNSFIALAKFMEINRNVGVGEIRAAFRYFDRDCDGKISVEDLRMAMEYLEENCSVEDCRRMIRRLDKSGGEMVSIDDFMAMMTTTMKPISR